MLSQGSLSSVIARGKWRSYKIQRYHFGPSRVTPNKGSGRIIWVTYLVGNSKKPKVVDSKIEMTTFTVFYRIAAHSIAVIVLLALRSRPNYGAVGSASGAIIDTALHCFTQLQLYLSIALLLSPNYFTASILGRKFC